MAKVKLEDAKEVSRKLVSALKPQAVILFGSVARSGIGEDLDLLIIPQKDNTSKKEAYSKVSEALEEYDKRFSIDYFVAGPALVRKLFLGGSPFLRLIQKEGKSLYLKDSKMEWMKRAVEDLEAAEILYREKYYQIACIHAQQALEKAMKGLLLDKGWELERIHSIRRLISYGESFGLNFDLPKDIVNLMDSLYRARYPGEEGLLPAGDPTLEEARSILSHVKEFFKQRQIL